jgi:hypothetical protein
MGRVIVGILLIGLVVVAVTSAKLLYIPGTTYTYEFATMVKTTASIDGEVQDQGNMQTNGHVTVTCQSIEGGMYGLEMKLSNLVFRDDKGEVISAGTDLTGDLEKYSVFFTQMDDGAVLSVYTSEQDSVWSALYKKGVISALQGLEDVQGSSSYSRKMVDVTGTHTTHYTRYEDGVIEGRYDDTMFDSGALPQDVKLQGWRRHRFGSQGKLLSATVMQSVQHFKGTPQYRDPQEGEGFLTKNSVIMSEGQLLVSLLSESNSPQFYHVQSMAELLDSKAGYVFSPLSDNHADEAAREVESMHMEELLTQVSHLVEAILINPLRLKEKIMYEVAHQLRHFMAHHPAAGVVIAQLLREGRTAGNAQWVDFILAEDISSASTPREEEPVTTMGDVPDPTYPHNKAKTWETKLGGSDFNVFAQAGYFAGTNFDCKQTGLNYKLRAFVKAGCHLFKHEEDFFTAEAVYAAINGATAENRLVAKLFGHSLKDEKLLPDIPGCPPEVVKDIASVQPGFRLSYTIVVVVIPVTFSAGVSAKLYLKWGYQFCPQNLQAHVDLRPGVTVTASASATAQIAVAKGGIELSGSVNLELRPTVMIDGNQCQFGVNLHRIQAPAQIKFDGWYQTWGCTIHHWKPHCGYGSRHEKVFWHWDGPAVDQPIWGELCQATLKPFQVTCRSQPF